MSWSWSADGSAASTVTFELVADGDGTRLRLTHKGEIDPEAGRIVSAGWPGRLERLATVAVMGWSFDWFSSHANDFNFDYGVSFTQEELESGEARYNYGTQGNTSSEREGVSVFYKDPEGRVFHTYSAYARGIDMVNAAYHYLDLVPQGRGEEPRGNPQSWVRRHDEYGSDSL